MGLRTGVSCLATNITRYVGLVHEGTIRPSMVTFSQQFASAICKFLCKGSRNYKVLFLNAEEDVASVCRLASKVMCFAYLTPTFLLLKT